MFYRFLIVWLRYCHTLVWFDAKCRQDTVHNSWSRDPWSLQLHSYLVWHVLAMGDGYGILTSATWDIIYNYGWIRPTEIPGTPPVPQPGYLEVVRNCIMLQRCLVQVATVEQWGGCSCRPNVAYCCCLFKRSSFFQQSSNPCFFYVFILRVDEQDLIFCRLAMAVSTFLISKIQLL